MAFVATSATVRGVRRHSIGPMLVEYGTFTAASGDTSGTITAASIASVDLAIISGGVVLNTATTYSGKVATLAFNDPVATVAGTYILLGR